MTDRRKIKALIKFWVAIGAISVIVGYGAFRSKDLVMGPRLSLSYPSNGAMVADAVIEVQGKAKNISFLTLNDGKIFTDESGEFKERLLLSYGYNVITLRAKDRFGRERVETLELIYK